MSEHIEKIVCVKNDLGLHLRAAGVLVQLASRFDADILITRGNMEANAKSIMSILSLAASCGTQLYIKAHGHDAKVAIEAIEDLFEQGFVVL